MVFILKITRQIQNQCLIKLLRNQTRFKEEFKKHKKFN